MSTTLSTDLPLLLLGWLVGGMLIWLPGLLSGVSRPLTFPVSAAIYGLTLTLLRVLQLPANVWLLVVVSALFAGLIRLVSCLDSGRGPDSSGKTDSKAFPSRWALAAASLGTLCFLLIGAKNFLHDPMGCCDNGFRWDYLAATTRSLGELNFYPPITSEHYKNYFYPDPMPLGFVSMLLPLRWLGLDGEAGRSLALPLLLSQFVAGIWLLQGLSQRLSKTSKPFAFVAIAFMATGLAANALSPSESFLLVLGVGSAVFSLLTMKSSAPSSASVLVFGLLASSPALIREYGVAFSIAMLIGFLIASFRWEMWRSIPAHTRLILFLTVIMGCIGPIMWYGYLFIISGNPLLSLPVAGFPGHPVHTPYLHEVAKSSALLALPASEVLRIVFWSFWLSMPLALFLSPQARHRWSNLNYQILFLALLAIPLFIRSMAWTSGGYGFALKVLMPGLFLAMAVLLSILDETPWVVGVLSVLMIKSLFDMSVPGAKYLIQSPIATLRRVLAPPEELNFYKSLSLETNQLLLNAQLCDPRGKISTLWVTDNANTAVDLKRRGLAATTVWSPDLAPIFDSTIPPDRLAAILEKKSIKFIHPIVWNNYGLMGTRAKLIDPVLMRFTVQQCTAPAP
jgi:hypothetical protein